ncbi:rod shape-determining protein RodA [Desulfoluna limicola]|uniref:Peptidoglycan glycosyltransferase RodA n=1 Tax=Desulfoluna limicola TaxID=2810562 RepID=A0ABM7PN94_9BACT|nr:rod shape-determining protein RodA [Desulfoluna limicola]BCS98547.1 rod shape-determining protein RodA [Desulfoluna limicola]
MIDRRVVEHFDWGLLLITLIISGLGLVALYSAVYAGNDPSLRPLFVKQLVWLGGGMGVMIATFCVDPKEFERWTPGIYIGCMLLLVAVLLVGRVVGGSRRWLVLGSLTLQPSELAKVGVILMLARYYARNATTRGLGFRELIKPAGIVLLPFFLIYLQPDLGTGLLIVMIAGIMTLFVKIERRTLTMLVCAGLGLSVAAWLFFLKAYQKQRVLTFLNPDRDPLGAGYHIIQSKIAIGSGMLTGKGFLKGTQNTLSFLPERHTDFILSVLAEEWGFLGTVLLVLMYCTLFVWSLNIAHKSKNTFGTITAVGVTAMLFWEVFINMGMVMGLMPVVGVPLPLVSYGGSSVVTSLMSIGLLMGVSMRRFKK